MEKHWIDNVDSYICPICGREVSTPAKYDYHCPKCGFVDENDAKYLSAKRERV